ncbi:hypothetical protein ACFX2I_015931 [Malus domestica]
MPTSTSNHQPELHKLEFLSGNQCRNCLLNLALWTQPTKTKSRCFSLGYISQLSSVALLSTIVCILRDLVRYDAMAVAPHLPSCRATTSSQQANELEDMDPLDKALKYMHEEQNGQNNYVE